jgi:hypothetical protein
MTKDEPHIEAAKYLAKVKLSHLLSAVERRPLGETIRALIRLVSEL